MLGNKSDNPSHERYERDYKMFLRVYLISASVVELLTQNGSMEAQDELDIVDEVVETELDVVLEAGLCAALYPIT